MAYERYKTASAMAQGQKLASLVLKNAKVLDVYNEEWINADVAIHDGVIIGVGNYNGVKEIECKGKYIVPGFIDAHLHLESTLVNPRELVFEAAKVGTTTYRYSEMYGVDENYIEMKGYTLAKGRNIQYMDIADNKQICVIGDYINRTAYGGNAVGQTIKLGPYKFRIVGVLKAKISNHDQQEGSDDDSVYLPYTTAMRLSNESSPDSYSAIMVDEGQANEAKAAVEQGLYDIFKSDNAYYVYSASEWLEEMNKMINMVIVILTGIASISLLVGGIGIMNIMLVSVTERTREIGIRKSLGAKQKDIRGQFVIEAGTTSAVGGVLGIVFGLLLARAATIAVGAIMSSSMNGITFSAVPTLSDIAVSFGVSVGIGVLFGYLPANKAAKLNPIDALRYD